MQDTPLTDVFAALGLGGTAAGIGLNVLYRAELTRPGKGRIAKAKLPQVEKALHEAIVRTCHKRTCREKARRDGRTVIDVAVRHCNSCGGEDNRAAVVEMLEAMRRSGHTKLLEGVGRFTFTGSDPLKRRWPKGVDEATAKDVREGAGGRGRQARPLPVG